MTERKIIAVTDRKLCTRPFLEQMERVAVQHPDAILLREKDLPEEEYEKLAGEVFALCEKHGIELILHSYPAAAEKTGVKKLHLPLEKLREYRAECGKEKNRTYDLEVGCSVHSLEEAEEAVQAGAAYLIAGHIYETGCKPGIPPRGLAFFRENCRATDSPVYAIGGSEPGDGRIEEVRQAGARGACMMSGFMKI